MPRRSIWSARQRAALFDLTTDEAALLRHYTLSDDDIEQIRARRGGTQPAGLRASALRLSISGTASGGGGGHRKHAGLTVEPELLAHISPLGWAHILLTGEYRWPKRR